MKIITLFFMQRKTCRLLCLGIIFTAVLWLFISLYNERGGTYLRVAGLRDIRVSSTEYPYLTYLVNKQHAAAFKGKRLSCSTATPITYMPHYDHYTFTFLYDDGQQIRLYYSPTSNKAYNMKYQLLAPSPDVKDVLLDLTSLYRQEIHRTYGTLLVWEEVDNIFPMYATARLTDIYTGKSFAVQRREGSSHVDAQPLTAEDTAIMKEIYGGRWSWDRRGIIVEVRGYRIAA